MSGAHPADDHPAHHQPAPEHRGRRPGEGHARDDIESAARDAFARDGFAMTSIRSVARTAGVDPALVRHYFRNKENLFASVIRLPFDPEIAVQRMTNAGPQGVGRELATVVAEILADPDRSQLVIAMIRAAATEPQGAQLIEGALNETVITPIVALLGAEHAEKRAALSSAQIIGFLMATLVLRMPPLVALDTQGVITALGPTLQHTLTGDLSLHA